MRLASVTTASSKLTGSTVANENKFTTASATLADDTQQYLNTVAAIYGMGASDLERISALALSSDALASSKVGLTTQSVLYGMAPDDSFDRLRTVSNSGGGFGSLSVAQNVQVLHEYDAAANDSNKTFTVPSDTLWRVEQVHCLFAADANAGNRSPTVIVRSAAGNVAGIYKTGISHTANQTAHHQWSPGAGRETSFIHGSLHIPFSPVWLTAAMAIQVYDDTAVSATGDDMTVNVLGQKVTL